MSISVYCVLKLNESTGSLEGGKSVLTLLWKKNGVQLCKLNQERVKSCFKQVTLIQEKT